MKINRVCLILFIAGAALLIGGLTLVNDDTIKNIIHRTYRCDRLTKEALPTDKYCGNDYTRAPEFDSYKLIGSTLKIIGAIDMIFALILWVRQRDRATNRL